MIASIHKMHKTLKNVHKKFQQNRLQIGGALTVDVLLQAQVLGLWLIPWVGMHFAPALGSLQGTH